jgi:hypothetical protein
MGTSSSLKIILFIFSMYNKKRFKLPKTIIRSRKPKNDRQHKDQKKKDKQRSIEHYAHKYTNQITRICHCVCVAWFYPMTIITVHTKLDIIRVIDS